MVSGLRIAGVELGGTKSIATIADGRTIIEQASFPTTTPDETLGRLIDQLRDWHSHEPFDALGIASFGPLQLDQSAPGFGALLPTPKLSWTGTAVGERLSAPFSCPWEIDTDVNAAALAEYLWGAGAGCESVCYITIGTGVGGGLVIGGKPVHGGLHPEIGHIRIRRASGDTFSGACSFHGDCIEGLVSGPALTKRFGVPAACVDDSHPVWSFVADDLAELFSILLLTTSATRLLVGGGVASARPFLLPLVQHRVLARLAGYLPYVTSQSIAQIISAPGLGDLAGPLGAVALGLNAASR